MITEKLRMIKSKSTEPSPVTSASNTTQIPSAPNEIAQITGRLNQIRPQIPQIDKLLLLHSKLTNPNLGTLDLVKKLTECRNLLVSQVEIISPDYLKKPKSSGFLMNLSQLNLLIEQVQRLFNSLVSKMKESAGVGGIKSTGGSTTGNTSIHIGNIAVVTSSNLSSSNASTTSSNNNLLNSASSISSLSTNSSTGSLSKFKVKPTLQTSSSEKYENLLIQRLTLPPDNTSSINSTNTTNSTSNSASARYNRALLKSRKNPKLKLTNQKHLKQRNILLAKELKNLRYASKYRTRIQDGGLGNINLHVTSNECQFIFRISQKYPFDDLLYRIEEMDAENDKYVLLPTHKEPKTFPKSITNIIRSYESSFKK